MNVPITPDNPNKTTKITGTTIVTSPPLWIIPLSEKNGNNECEFTLVEY